MKSQPKVPLSVASMALILASLACGLGAAEPTKLPVVALSTPTLAPIATSPSTDVGTPSPPEGAAAIPERRRITLEFPPRIRAGDSDVIRLSLEMDKYGNLTPTAEVAGNKVTGGTVEIPNLYETHHVTAEARLDMAGVDVRPGEMISSPLAPGQSVTFYWSVRPQGKGTFKGTVWLFLRFVEKVTGEQSQRAISAQVIQIQSTDLFGLPADFARSTGAVGSVVGGILGFPFLEDILKHFFKRRRRQ